jgi:hypothetical protein
MEVPMSVPSRNMLLQNMDFARSRIEALLPVVDPAKEIYPGWTIRDLLAHMSGWDDATIESLRSHLEGSPLSFPAIHNLDVYNSLTVISRKQFDFDHILKEWQLTRQVLHDVINQMPEEMFHRPFFVPWGGKITITDLMIMFHDHEDEHTLDIRAWLINPNEPLKKEGY